MNPLTLLTVVVSYNLPGYLINFVNSYLTHCKLGTLLIVDNQSTDPVLCDYLKSIQSDRVLVKIMDVPNLDDQKVGSLYLANNFALEYAKKNDYRYILFCQDDMQFFGFDDNLDLSLERLYSDETTSMVNPTVMKGVDERFFAGYKWNSNIKAWINIYHGSIDVGIISVKWATTNNFKFLGSEGETASTLHKDGFFVAVLNEPFLAYLPWPPVRRSGFIIGEDLPITNHLFFRPLRQKKLLSSSLNKVSPKEIYDYCAPNYAKVMQPYWYTDILYYPLTIKTLIKLRYVGEGIIKIPSRSHFIRQVGVGFLSRFKMRIKHFLWP